MLDRYQIETRRTAIHGLSERDDLLLGAIGLCGEAGEAAELVKKHAFHGEPLDREALAAELGDVLWYLAHLAGVLGISLHDVAAANVEKLRIRYPNGFPSTATSDPPPRVAPQ
ncbi:nucleoside triphosphate pyrophosphohydrolase family protein [Wenjunlia tyrosinilytica]|jgi:NTP pyrophosphatase (non-canonical NTP hydrolase)|uniref:Nucleotide pyrophosphohydrolase n=1 Tax=Wenjunlia tyrosinilytica TaxID=1544741 RepID=A0A918E0V6_9ACTN|nr:nucleoside triphosphate pyrophosphohydrolase family protein [Wenjunlia tyrosinilytica]GGO94378.1 nucleotide pyrophosphohydrolase [Wenjunlia tyrosinilytica]